MMEGTTLVLNDKQLKRVRILIDDYVNLRGNSRCQDRSEIEELNEHIKFVCNDKDNKKIVARPVVYIQKKMFKARRGLIDMEKYVKESKRLNKNETNKYIENIKNPLCEAFMDVFPGEDNTDWGDL